MSAYLIQLLLWLGYGISHSVPAATPVKQFFQRKMGKGYRYYRIFYNVLALAFLIGILIYQQTLPVERLWSFDWRTDVVGNVFIYTGLFIVLMAISGYNLREFSGLQFSPQNASAGSGTLKTDGLLRYVRHPVYTGTFLFIWGLFLSDGLVRTLIMSLCITFYTLIGIYFEEKKLVAEFGDNYLEYRRRVPMLFPKIPYKKAAQ